MNDELGKRMKDQYEDRTRYFLPRRTFTIIRVDGKAFHSFTKGFKRPFDKNLMNLMDHTAMEMCRQIQGCVMAYTQSDEISLLLTDFSTIQTDAWFDGNIQKISSVAASIATAAFNQYFVSVMGRRLEAPFALFDGRVFTIPDVTEVINYFIWRQADATRNSIQMAAQSVYSQKELHGKSCNVLQEMLFQKGINWNDYTSGEKRGRAIIKVPIEISAEAFINKNGEPEGSTVIRNYWISLTGEGSQNETPIFTQDRSFILSRIPEMKGNK